MIMKLSAHFKRLMELSLEKRTPQEAPVLNFYATSVMQLKKRPQ